MATRARRPRPFLPFVPPAPTPLADGWLTWVVAGVPVRFFWERHRVGPGEPAPPTRLIDALRPDDIYADPLRPGEVVHRQLVSLRTHKVIPIASAEELAEALRDAHGWARAR